MTTTSCPNCGKPLRPGARFCGSCGSTISAAAFAQEKSAPASPGTIACPQCGKPVRVGAKFCSNCGKVLQQEPAPSIAPPATGQPAPGPDMRRAVPPATSSAVTDKKPIASPPGRVVAPPAKQPGAGRRVLYPLALLGLVLICVAAAVGGYVYYKDPLHWFPTATTSPIALTSSQTPALIISETAVNAALETQQAPPPTFTLLVQPSATETLPPTQQVTSTVQLTTSIPISGTIAPSSSSIWLQDDFSGALNVNWKVWGNPKPIIRSGPGDKWLELTATDRPTQAGVTSRAEIPNRPGCTVQFEGQVNPGYANYPLFLDWDPVQYDRGPENTNPTVLHMVIHNSRIILQAPAANNTCQKEISGEVKHIYVIKFMDDKMVELYIDDSQQPICQLDLGVRPMPGRISFTGTGWLTRIIVTGTETQ